MRLAVFLCVSLAVAGPSKGVASDPVRVRLFDGETISEVDARDLNVSLRLEVTDDGVHWRMSHRALRERVADGYGVMLTAKGRHRVGSRRVARSLDLHRFEGMLPGVGNGHTVTLVVTRPDGLAYATLGTVRVDVPPPMSITHPKAAAEVHSSEPMHVELRGHDPSRSFLDYALEGPDTCIHDELRREVLGVSSPAWLQLGLVPGQSCDATLHVLAKVAGFGDSIGHGEVRMYRRASVAVRLVEDVKDTGIVAHKFEDRDVIDPRRQREIRAGRSQPSPAYGVDLARAQLDVNITYERETFEIKMERTVWGAAQRAFVSSGDLEGIVVVDGQAHAFDLGSVNRYSGTIDDHTFALPRQSRHVDVYARHQPSGRVFALGRVELPAPPKLDIRPSANSTIRQKQGAKILVSGPPAQFRWEVTFDEPDIPDTDRHSSDELRARRRIGCAQPGINGAASNGDLAPREIVFLDETKTCQGALVVSAFSTHQRAPARIEGGAQKHDGHLANVRVHLAYRERVPLLFAE